MTDVQKAIVEGLISSAAISLGIWLIQQLRYFIFLWLPFHKKKFILQYKDSKVPVREVTLTVCQNVISYKGRHIEKRQEVQGTFSGEIIMNPFNLKVGEGVHHHDYYDGFNFPHFYIKDSKTIYSEALILLHLEGGKLHDFQPQYHAFVWKHANRQ